MRTTFYHNSHNIELLKQQLLQWAQQFNEVVWLDSNNYKHTFSSYDAVLAVDAFTYIKTDYAQAFENLKKYLNTLNDWSFGYLTYDLKNGVEDLTSNNYDGLQFPDLYFFQPKKIFFIKDNKVEIQYLNVIEDKWEADLKIILNLVLENTSKSITPASNNMKINHRISKNLYLNKINNMLTHIHKGDIYEANFCQEFYAEGIKINPLHTYLKLNDISNTPFATYLKLDDKYVFSASPERYLKKEGSIIISQPIKGTAKRDLNEELDEQLKQDLFENEKERSENIMIVDLVRNDLSKTAIKGTVTVDELCKIYTFDQVHQMISTVSSQIAPETNSVDVIKSTFPMGSMTGAPKISAMKIIETLEETKRGLYSGSVGYFTPSGDFDFNVIIRSILYNESQNYISFSVGSAITSKSDPHKEYEECLVKAKAMRQVLEQ